MDTGFKVLFGPVRASDIKEFIKSNYVASKDLRQVKFDFIDRIKLIPVDFIYGKKYFLYVLVIIILISGVDKNIFTIESLKLNFLKYFINVLLAYSSGIILTPLLLPYLQTRSFALKGLLTGLTTFALLSFYKIIGNSIFESISWLLIIASVSSFAAMNFTGSSTYTSLSGVMKEMKKAIPFQIAFCALGLILLVISKFL